MNVLRKILKNLRDDITDELRSLRETSELPNYYRAVVEDVINDPLALSDEQISMLKGYVRDPYTVDALPRNCIVGRRIRTGADAGSDPEIFFPFFPSHISLPVKPGETVWTFYESNASMQENGYWMCRISERRDVEDPNFTHSDRRFLAPSKKQLTAAEKIGAKAASDEDKLSFPNGMNTPETHSLPQSGNANAYDEIVDTAIATALTAPEPVPRFTQRPGDMTLQGSNNTLINLGRKRIGSANEQALDANGDPTRLGAIDIVVGRGSTPATAPATAANARAGTETDKLISADERSAEGDIDLVNDAARVYVAMRLSADQEFGVQIPTGFQDFEILEGGPGSGVNSSDPDRSAVVIRADQIRLLARNDIKIQLANPDDPGNESAIVMTKSGDIVVIPGARGVIKLGGDDADKAILMTDFPAIAEDGVVTSGPIQTTMGGLVGTGKARKGTFSTKVLIK